MVAAGRTEIAEVLVVADSDDAGHALRRLPPEARRVRPARGAGDPRRPRRRARPHHGRRPAAGRLRPRAHGEGSVMTDPPRHRRPGARLPRPDQPRRRLRRGGDHRALPPRQHPARRRRRRLHLAELRRAGEGRARPHPHPHRHRGELPRTAPTRSRRPAPRPAGRSPTAPTRSTWSVPWRRLAEGHPEAVAASVREIKDICGAAHPQGHPGDRRARGPGPDPPRRRRGAGRRRRLPEDLHRQGAGERHAGSGRDPAAGDPRQRQGRRAEARRRRAHDRRRRRLPRPLRPPDGRRLGDAGALPHRRLGRAHRADRHPRRRRRRRQEGRGY